MGRVGGRLAILPTLSKRYSESKYWFNSQVLEQNLASIVVTAASKQTHFRTGLRFNSQNNSEDSNS